MLLRIEQERVIALENELRAKREAEEAARLAAANRPVASQPPAP